MGAHCTSARPSPSLCLASPCMCERRAGRAGSARLHLLPSPTRVTPGWRQWRARAWTGAACRCPAFSSLLLLSFALGFFLPALPCLFEVTRRCEGLPLLALFPLLSSASRPHSRFHLGTRSHSHLCLALPPFSTRFCCCRQCWTQVEQRFLPLPLLLPLLPLLLLLLLFSSSFASPLLFPYFFSPFLLLPSSYLLLSHFSASCSAPLLPLSPLLPLFLLPPLSQPAKGGPQEG
mmetsp:Transcript_28683/g.73288  ORF Transcript_28683/g.73288 Transcript_28683/m.73288 type:complete len:233 (+) Transcript_28683:331-1029(+)